MARGSSSAIKAGFISSVPGAFVVAVASDPVVFVSDWIGSPIPMLSLSSNLSAAPLTPLSKLTPAFLSATVTSASVAFWPAVIPALAVLLPTLATSTPAPAALSPKPKPAEAASDPTFTAFSCASLGIEAKLNGSS
jgi:hypothetical protein